MRELGVNLDLYNWFCFLALLILFKQYFHIDRRHNLTEPHLECPTGETYETSDSFGLFCSRNIYDSCFSIFYMRIWEQMMVVFSCTMEAFKSEFKKYRFSEFTIQIESNIYSILQIRGGRLISIVQYSSPYRRKAQDSTWV